MARISPSPTLIEPHSPTQLKLGWNNGKTFTVPYVEMRYYCPCAGCIDENSGQRTIQKESINPDIRATGVQLVGRYAVQIIWSDRHDTGMYHYDRLYELCEKQGTAV